ncbi:MAG: hypothetical protein HGA31_05300 [Candidatus Moranbacteria bacterium]|nr:hypothetical protein [Candidatus Moranbacteria bacterium]
MKHRILMLAFILYTTMFFPGSRGASADPMYPRVVQNRSVQHYFPGSRSERVRIWDKAGFFGSRAELGDIVEPIDRIEARTGVVTKLYTASFPASPEMMAALLQRGGEGGSDIIFCLSPRGNNFLFQVGAVQGDGKLWAISMVVAREEIPMVIRHELRRLVL